MTKQSHRFVEKYEGFMGFGFSREVDEATLICYLQKFSDDELMSQIINRMSESDMRQLFELLSDLMKRYLTGKEYRRYFLKEENEE